MARSSIRSVVADSRRCAPFACSSSESGTSPFLRRQVLVLLRSPQFARGSLLSLMLACIGVPQNVSANPLNGTVTAGNATIVTGTPNRLDVVQTSDRAIINWQGFSIDQGELTNFQQPGASSVTLNRVTGNQASSIAGKLTANGTVMLVNPNGIVIGKTGVVDVAGLVATTANIKDDDLLAQRLNFNQASANPNAKVINEGRITIGNQGLAALVAPNVKNSGVIEARLGKVALGGAQTFSLDFQGDGLLSFNAGSAVAVTPRDENGAPVAGLVENTGRISASGGTVQLTATAVKGVVDNVINTTGLIEARSVGMQNGEIVLSGGASGTVSTAGTLDVSSEAGQGGAVRINGEKIAVTGDALINASGAAGGGTIDIGHESGAELASAVRIDRGTHIRADATTQGNGGNVVVLSADSTSFAGSISARGGASGGDGGFVEVSSRDRIGLSGSVDLNAPHGATGNLLLDPATLTITDAGTGGSLDGAASDGTIVAGDANVASNTVSRGTLEALSGSTNLTLEATGLITVNAMLGGVINLQTDASHSFTLRSTTAGGINFVDADTEIRTQGGDITLQALKTGALTNIGRLTSNGGDITLVAGGLVQLGNVIDAGAGTAAVTSLSNSIQSVGASNVIGSSVTLSAAYGSVGESGNPLNTSTGRLTLATGGNLFVADDTALSQLSITSVHAVDTPFVFEVSAPQLSFDVTDDGANYSLTSIVNASDLELTFFGDRNIIVGDVNAVAGDVQLRTRAGSILDDGNTATGITGTDLALTSTGAIGATGASLTSTVATLAATTGSGGVNIDNTGTLDVASLTAVGGTSAIASTGDVLMHNVAATGATLSLTSTTGSVFTAGGPNDTIATQTLSLNAADAVGTVGTPLRTTATALNATAANGIYAATTGATALGTVTSTSGPISIAAAGNITVDRVDASPAGAVSLTATNGSITASTGGTNVVADTLDFTSTAAFGNATFGVAATTITGTAGSGGINLTQTGATTLSNLSTTGQLTVNSTAGNVVLGALQATNATIHAAAGDILDDANAATATVANSVTLTADAGSLGTSVQALESKTPSLTLSSASNIFVGSTVALSTLNITNTHPVPSVINTLIVAAPYLQFDVTDTGSQFQLSDITGVTLNALSFTGDQTSTLTKLYAAGSVAVRALQGDLLDDGNGDTRLTGSSISLTADHGNLGTSATNGALETNTSSLTATTGGNLFINDISDLSALNISSTHEAAAQDYQYVLTAPSLRFDLTDSSSGYALTNVSDASSLTFTFQGDRTITAGTIDTTRSGSVNLRSTAGSVLDDGDKNTQILGDAVTLGSTLGDVGSTVGSGYMDVITRQLSGNTPAGGFTVALPYSANTVSSNGAVTISSITAAGPVAVTVDNGDLRVNNLLGSGAVALTTSNGSILSSNVLHATDLTLNASGAIGITTTPLLTQVTGNITANAAGGGFYLTNTGAVDLLTASAAGPIKVIGTSDIVVGAIGAGANEVTVAASGNLLDDGNAATRVAGSSVALTAQSGSLGAVDDVIGVTTPSLALTSGNDVYVDDSVDVSSLSIAGTSSSAVGVNVYSVVAPDLTFSATDDGSTISLDSLGNTTPLDFGFSTQRTLHVGAVDTNGGAATLASVQGSVLDDGNATTTISASTLTVSAGNSIGASGAGNALAIDSTALTLTALGDFYIDDSSALSSLALTSTAVAGQTNNFGIAAAGQTFALSDDGSTHYLQTVTGPGFGAFSFTGKKSIKLGTIAATGAVALTTTGGSSNVIMDGVGGSRVSGSSVAVNTLGSSGGNIGTSGTNIAIGTGSLSLSSPGNIYVSDNQALSTLAIKQTHASTTNYTTAVAASGLTFSLTDGATASLGNIASSGMNFSYDTDRVVQVGTIDVGGSGTVTLVGAGTYQTQAIQDDGNQGTRITAGTVNIGSGTNQGYVGAGGSGDIDVSTANLVVKSTGDIYVSDSAALSSLAVTASHSNSGNRTYAISASGLTFGVADQSLLVSGGQGTVINNVSASGLDFSFASDNTIQVVTLNTGGTGRVTLTGNIVDDNNDSTRITANTLTLNGSTAGEGPNGILKELDSTVSVLNTSLAGQLYLINTGNLTLGTNSVTNSATITSLNGSFFSNGADAFATRSLSLTANNGSLGTNVTPLSLNARSLSLQSGYDMFVDSLVDLVSLNVTNTHAAVRTNTLSIVAPNLTFGVDDIGGNQFDMVTLTDSTGIDFSFSGDKEIRLGAVDVKGGNALSIASSADIFDDGDGATELTGESVNLSAGGSIGRLDPVEVNTTNLQLRMGGDVNVHDNLDLTSLSMDMAGQSGLPTYAVTAPNLNFDVTDDGTTTTLNDVTDTDGLNFSLRTVHSQSVQVIDTQRYGTVSLYSTGSIAGSGVPADRITAASSSFETLGGGGIGVLANPILLSSPLLSIRSTGDIYVDSDTHIDRLGIVNQHGNAGTYSILSPDLTFGVTDSVSTVSLNNIVDTTGLNLSYSSDHDFQLGTIDLGTAGNLSLSGTTGGIDFAGDGNVNTLITAVGVNISTTSGAIGTAGAGNELNIAAQNFTGNAGGGGVRLDFRGPVVINSINSNGASELVNAGDIAIGSFNANGQSLTVTAGGSILSGSISQSSNLTLTAGGGIGTVSRIQTNANGGTTTLNASAADGGVSLNEAYTLTANNVTATEAVDLTSRYGTAVGTINSSGGPVTLTTSEGSITGTSVSNLITGTAVTLNANYSQSAQSIGTSGTRLRVDTPELTLNARGNFYVTDLADLDSLTILRSASSTGSPGGAISLVASNLTFNASDNGSTMTLTNVTDTTGLDFTLTSYSAIAVDTLNVGSLSDVSLTSARYNTDGTINSTGGGTITAGDLTLATSGGVNGSIGTSGTPLRTAVTSIAANAQNGGVYISQNGALTLNNVNSGGALSVATTSGNLTVGSVSYGNNQPLTLTASAASLLDDGVNSTNLLGTGTGAINLSAANGIGTALSPFAINDQSTNNINATVTGAGSAYLDITSSANPLVNITAANGSIDVITGGLVTLANLVSTTDVVGNNISATTRSGNLGLGVVTAGALHGSLDLRAPTGAITALNGSNSISAFDPNLSALNGIGTLSAPLNVTGQSIVADTVNGGVYLSPTGVAVLGFVRSQNGTVNVNGTSDVVAANVISGAGGVTLSTSGVGSTIYTGNINAGTAGVTLTATNGRIVDDGVPLTSVRGGAGNFTAANFVGTSGTPIATRLTSLTANVSGTGGIYIDQTGDLALSNLTSGGGAISIVGTDALTGSGAINANGGPVTLTAGTDVLLTGSISTVGADPNLAAVTISGGDSIAVNNVTSTGVQDYDNDTTVTGNLTGLSLLIDGKLTLGGVGTRALATTSNPGRSIVINDDIDGAGAGLSLTAIGGVISIDGDATNLASFASDSDLTTLGKVATTGAQTYTGNTVFNGLTYTTTGGGFDVIGSAVFGADASIATNSGDVDFIATVDGAHALTIDAGAGDVNFSSAIGGLTPMTTLVVNSGGLTTFGGTVTVASLTTDAPGTLSIVPATIITSGAQSYGEALTLSNDMTFTGTSVTFGGAVNGTTPGQEDLTVVGDAVFNGGAGGTVALQTIAVSGTASVSGTMATTNAQTYGGAISLIGDTVFTLGNGMAFNSTIDGTHAMTVNAGASNVTFNQAIGGTAGVGDVIVNSTGDTTVNGAVTAATFATDAGGNTLLNAATVSTTGVQSYGDAVVVGTDVTLTGSNVAMLGTLDDSAAGAHAVTIAGDATLDGAVGATAALESLNVSGVSSVNGGGVTTTTSQSYGGLILGADTTLTGTTISSGTVDGTAAGQQSLDVAGDAVFTSNVGSTQALESMEIDGTTQLGGNVTTIGMQTYNDAVTLQNNVVLASNGGDVTFESTVDGGQAPSAQLALGRASALAAPTINGGQALTVNAVTGDVTFDGTVGGTSRLGDLRVNTAGATVFNAPVYAASVATDVPGTVALNGGIVDTSGTQSYGEIATLGADTLLTGATVTFVQTVDSDAPGQRSLAINGAAVFDQAVGATSALRSVAVTGASTLNGGKVVTTGSQSYAGATTVGVDTTLTSGDSVNFGSTLDAVNTASLNVAAPAGSITVAGAIGGVGPFDNFVVLAGQDTTFGGAVTVNDFDAIAGAGTTKFNGPLTAVTGDVRIDNSHGGNVVFAANSPINAATGFVISGAGGVQLASDVTVGAGPISVEGLLTLIGPKIAMRTDGDMTFSGISGPGTILTVAAGSGTITAGSPTGGSEKKVILRDMVVETALGAQFYGSLSNIGGGGTAKFVKSTLFGPPYYFNDVPFGPLEFVDRLVAQQARKDLATGQHLTRMADDQNAGDYPEDSPLDSMRAPASPEVLKVEPAQYRCQQQHNCEVRVLSR